MVIMTGGVDSPYPPAFLREGKPQTGRPPAFHNILPRPSSIRSPCRTRSSLWSDASLTGWLMADKCTVAAHPAQISSPYPGKNRIWQAFPATARLRACPDEPVFH